MTNDKINEFTSAFRLITPLMNILLTLIATLILANMNEMKINQQKMMEIVIQNDKRITVLEYRADNGLTRTNWKREVDND